MTYLLDTNVVSELRKPRPHGAVVAWKAAIPAHQLAIPAIVLAESQAGIELTRKQNPAKAAELETWLDHVMTYYTILAADGLISRRWARLMHKKSPDLGVDAMVAATALVMGLTVATRNVRRFEMFRCAIFNPFTFVREAKH